MTSAIIGSNSYIATALLTEIKESPSFGTVYQCSRTAGNGAFHIDLEQPEKFDFTQIEDAKYIIFAAAVSSPDECSKNFERSWNINVVGTGFIIRKALAMGIRVLFLSSDAVFGNTDKICDEDSKVLPDTAYGKMKAAIEDEFSGEEKFKAVRLSYVVSAHDRFVTYCKACMKNGEKAEIFHPFYRNCITLGAVNESILWLMKNWNQYSHSVLNLAGTELVSRIRIADEINRLCGNRLDYYVHQPQQEFFQNRPAIMHMKSKYLYESKILKRESFTENFRREWMSE